MQGFIQWGRWGGSFPTKTPSFPPKRKEMKREKESEREKGERGRRGSVHVFGATIIDHFKTR